MAGSIHHLPSQDNILVDASGCTRLNDFGFTNIASLNYTEASAPGFKGSFRWMAPELFSVGQNVGKPAIPTRQSDVFALGMVTFEVMTSSLPDIPVEADLVYPGVHGMRAVSR